MTQVTNDAELIYFLALQRLEKFTDFLLAQVPLQQKLVKQIYGIESISRLSPEQRNELLIKMGLSLIGETMEFLEAATDWKVHKLPQPHDHDKALEEYVDLLKFALNIAIFMPFDMDKLKAMFQKKTAIVEARFKAEFGEGSSRAAGRRI